MGNRQEVSSSFRCSGFQTETSEVSSGSLDICANGLGYPPRPLQMNVQEPSLCAVPGSKSMNCM